MLLRMRTWTVLVKVLDTVDTNLGIGIEMKYPGIAHLYKKPYN